MICKWCGAKVERTDKKCRRCGKEAPAMSECGGFYPPPKPAVVGDPRPAAPRYPAQPQQKKKSGSGLLVLVCALVAAVLLLSILSLMMTLTNSRKLEALSQKNSAPASATQATEEPTEATEPLTLAQQDVSVRVDFDPAERENGVEVTADGAVSVKSQGHIKGLAVMATRYEVTVTYEEAGRNHELYLDLRSSDREREAGVLLDPEDELELTDGDLSAFACKLPECFGKPANEKDYGFSLARILDRNGNPVDLSKYTLEGAQKREPVAFVQDKETGTVYFVIYADFLEAMEEDSLKKDDVAFTYEFCYQSQDGGTLTIALGDINFKNIEND